MSLVKRASLRRIFRSLSTTQILIGSSLALTLAFAAFRALIFWPTLQAGPFAGAFATYLRASLSDWVICALLLGVFLAAQHGLGRAQGPAGRGATLYLALCSLLMLWGAANIEAVRLLGGPLTVQWLSFADLDNSSYMLDAIASFLQPGRILIILVAICAFVAACLGFACLVPGSQDPPPGHARRGWLSSAGLVVASVAFALAALEAEPKLVNPAYALVASAFNDADVVDGLAAGGDAQTRLDAMPRAVPPVRPSLPEGALKNVVVFVMESTSARFSSGYGGPFTVTPTLTALLPNSLRVTDAYAHAPASNYSLVSIIAGIVPELSAYGMADNRPNLVIDGLPALFATRGYRTGFFSSSDNSFQNTGGFADLAGFDTIRDSFDWTCDKTVAEYQAGSSTIQSSNDLCTVPPVTTWLDEDADAPFFLMIWTAMQHYPYYEGDAPQAYVEDPDLNRHLNAVRTGDQALGQLVDHLRAAGRLDDTLIVVVGDHGEAFGEHGQFGHATEVYEENLRIPFYLINPLAFNGEVADLIAGLSDIAPTIADLFGLQAPDSWQGKSLFAADRPDSLMFFAAWNGIQVGVRTGDVKLWTNTNTRKTRLFDLANDPGETVDLAESQPELLADTKADLAAWLRLHDTQTKTLIARGEDPVVTGTATDGIVIRASGTRYLLPPRAEVRLDGKFVAEIAVTTAPTNADAAVTQEMIDAAEATFNLPFTLPDCPHLLEITFLNDDWEGEGLTGDNNLFLGRIRVGAKFYDPWQFQAVTEGVGEEGDRLFSLWRWGTVAIPLDPGPECMAQDLTAAAAPTANDE